VGAGGGQISLATGLHEGRHVVGPGGLVEVRGEEPARRVGQERVDLPGVEIERLVDSPLTAEPVA